MALLSSVSKGMGSFACLKKDNNNNTYVLKKKKGEENGRKKSLKCLVDFKTIKLQLFSFIIVMTLLM